MSQTSYFKSNQLYNFVINVGSSFGIKTLDTDQLASREANLTDLESNFGDRVLRKFCTEWSY